MAGIVNARLMSRLATKFNLGADILGKGNRTVEKMLGADKMSGDTVSVTIMDSGNVYKDSLDLSGQRGKMGVHRASVPVRVKPIGIAAEASVGELTLAIQDTEIMGKRVANLQDTVNKMAYRTLLGGSQAFVAEAGLKGPERDQAYRQAAFDAEAYCVTSKFAGNTYGIAHPQTWNRVVPSLMGNYGANDRIGKELYENELGDFLGFRWTKGMDTMRISAAATGIGNIAVGADGELTAVIDAIAGNKGSEDGEVCPMPVELTDTGAGTVHKVECVDALGKPTGEAKRVMFKWSVAKNGWVLANPLFLRGPRKNAHSYAFEAAVAQYEVGDAALDTHGFGPNGADFEWYPDNSWNTIRGTGAPTEFTFTCTDVLTEGKTYLAPMVMWKEPDFLIAVKGIEKMAGADSFTIPTEYSDRGIMPWRGTYWTDKYASLSLFRVDALFGFGVYQGCSMASVFIPMD